MISTTYDLRCETFRFASRNICIRFWSFWGGSEARNENGGGAEFVSIRIDSKCCFRGASDRIFAEDAKGSETLQGGAKAHLTH
jgi:hypothetical protein